MPSVRERQRRHHSRSKNGCTACKQRHTHCDEQKPVCGACLRIGTDCENRGAEFSNVQMSTWQLLQRDSVTQSPAPGSLLSAARTDPFDTLPVTLSRNSNILLDHFNSFHILITGAFRRPPGGAMFDFLMKDQAMVHAGLLLAANHWVKVGGDGNLINATFYHHKIEAIRFVNEGLGDQQKAISDGVVGAVACLAILEAMSGSVEVATIHLSGLERLVRMRGDLHTQSMSPILQRVVLLADLFTCSAAKTTQRFVERAPCQSINFVNETHTPKSSSQLPDGEHISATPEPTYVVDPTFFSQQIGLDPESTKMFLDLHCLSFDVTNHNNLKLADSAFTDELQLRIKDTESFIDVLFHDVLYSHPNPTVFRGSRVSLAIPGYIYLYSFLRNIPPDSTIFIWMTELEKRSLEQFGPHLHDLYPMELLFWMLFTSLSASLVEAEKVWFLLKLRETHAKLGFETWDDAKLVLKKFSWIDRPEERRFVDLWDEINRTDAA